MLGLVALSAITVAPAAEPFAGRAMLGVAVSLLFWLLLVIWARGRLRVSAAPAPALAIAWAGRAFVVVAVVYVFGFLLFVVG